MKRTTAAATALPLGRVRGLLLAARAVLLGERLMLAIWPAAALAQLFLALALFNLMPDLPGELHAGLLALFALGFALLLIRGFRDFAWPRRPDLIRRLERDSRFQDRPLLALTDRLSAGVNDPETVEIWRRHQERTLQAMGPVRLGIPRPNLARRDPHALRAASGLILAVAVIGTWGDWLPRLEAALHPRFAAAGPMATATLDAWLSPPDYTGLAPIFLKGTEPGGTDTAAAAGAPVTVPAGSTLVARVSAANGIIPDLAANGETVPFDAIDADHYQISRPIVSSDAITVGWGGRRLGDWPITLILDQPPDIVFTGRPAGTNRAALQIDYAGADDYGVTAVTAIIAPAPAEDFAAAAAAEPMRLDLGAPTGAGKDFRTSSFQDLTAHPWAGLPALITLEAKDGAGQTAVTETLRIDLPARVFAHPIARRLVEERRRLTRDGEAAREPVAQALRAVSERPDTYNDDLVVFLGLRVAAQRLDGAGPSGAVIPDVQGLVWDLALRLEDGGLSLAERELRQAQQALAEALEREASADDIAKLMDALQTALDRYLDAMEQQMRDAMESGGETPDVPEELAREMLGREDLQAMMDQMRDLTETGARDAAREMLSRLQQMLETMQTGRMAEMNQPQNQAMDMLRQLQDLAGQQQSLLDQTFRQGQIDDQQRAQGFTPQSRAQRSQAQARAQAFAQQQEELRRELGEMMRQLGEKSGTIPRSLGDAEQAMRDAERSLRAGMPREAVEPQSNAVEQLQQGMGEMAQQLMQQMFGEGMTPGQGRGMGQRGRDPLGRPLPGFGGLDTGDVAIPDREAVQRAREILDELRRRAGESSRPRIELDYIDRLLRQF